MQFQQAFYKALLFALIFAIRPNFTAAQPAGGEKLIQLNQVGFYPSGTKKAVIEKNVSGSFYLVSQESDERVFSGKLSDPRQSQYGKKVVRIADFSSFDQRGKYRVYIPDIGYSHSFRVDKNIYASIADASLKGYYFQRASTELPEVFAGKWHRKAGHPDDSVLVHASAATEARPEGTVIHSSKGWYDAGDYNKYIVNSGITVATLLSLYEDFPAYVKTIDIDFPERNNDIPDLLDEVLWNLRWMLTMQDPADGGVYHKLTSPNFSGMVVPAADTDVRYVVQKSTAATLDFAAVMAQASRIFDDYPEKLPGLADSCLSAAKKAWQWAQDHPNQIYNQQELNEQFNPDINTGAYGDTHLQDEFTWAGIELYITTKNENYYPAAHIELNDEFSLPSWSQVRSLGYYTLLRYDGKLTSAAPNDLPVIREALLQFAENLVEGGRETAYQTVMGYRPENFGWGSNSVVANQAIALIQAYKLTPEQKYLHAAISNIDYLLGRNATGYSFVTGYGNKTPMHPHHRPSVSDSVIAPVPGLLVGGPNPGQQDDCEYPSDLPDESYSDTVCSYASNEIAINWNAPLVYVLHAVEALQDKIAKK